MINVYYPLRSLQDGHWFKLICGASFQHLPAIRNLVLAYALAGADCVDVAADPAVVVAAREALDRAENLAHGLSEMGGRWVRPLLMVSLNDGEDPHFRKAVFDAATCPPDCDRPCEMICPAQAITFPAGGGAGVLTDRCYGCGRCLPVCPLQKIETQSYLFSPSDLLPLVAQGVNAIEIHTQVGRRAAFQALWQAIAPVIPSLALVAVSCPDGDGVEDYLRSLVTLMQPQPQVMVWQADGRPMSGDIGDGTTHATVRFSQKLLAARLPGYVQLAGGTNGYTVAKLRSLGLVSSQQASQDGSLPSTIAGVAYGSYARKLLTPVLDCLEPARLNPGSLDPTPNVAVSGASPGRSLPPLAPWAIAPPPSDLASTSLASTSRFPPSPQLEDHPILLHEALTLARSLVSQIKSIRADPHTHGP